MRFSFVQIRCLSSFDTETTVSVYTLVIITIFQNSTKIKVKIEKKATDSATEIFLKIICILEQQNESEVMSN